MMKTFLAVVGAIALATISVGAIAVPMLVLHDRLSMLEFRVQNAERKVEAYRADLAELAKLKSK